jgi:hypothetical protein
VISDLPKWVARSRSNHSCSARDGRRAGLWGRWAPAARSRSLTAAAVKVSQCLGGRNPSVVSWAAICA